MRNFAVVAVAMAVLSMGVTGCGPTSTLEGYHSPEAQEGQAAAHSPIMQKPAKPAPDFTLKDQNGQDVTLSKLRGQWVVLYFYPQDDTPGCTCEATEFTKILADFKNANAKIYGISSDSVRTHQTFIKLYKLDINLLSDPDHAVMRNYGAWVDARLGDFAYQRMIRTTYIVGPDGTVQYVWPEVIPNGHAKRVMEMLKQLQSGKAPMPGAPATAAAAPK